MSDEILLMMNQHAGWIAILLSAVVSTLLSVGIPTLWKMRNVIREERLESTRRKKFDDERESAFARERELWKQQADRLYADLDHQRQSNRDDAKAIADSMANLRYEIATLHEQNVDQQKTINRITAQLETATTEAHKLREELSRVREENTRLQAELSALRTQLARYEVAPLKEGI